MNSNNLRWKVCVRCFTYNQAAYITDALDGFAMQQTDFPYVCTIVDDASTDGEPDVIRQYLADHFDVASTPEADGNGAYTREMEYGTLIFAPHRTNRNCSFAVLLLKENHYSIRKPKLPYLTGWTDGVPYIALCEGDDYWTAPHKLQTQVAFLDSHPDSSACLTKFISYNENIHKVYALIGEDYTSIRDMLWRDLQFGTATLVFRNNLYSKYLQEIAPQSKNWLMGDKPLVLYLAAQGRVKTLKDVTTTYRILDSSASHSKDVLLQLKRARNTIDIYLLFAKMYLPGDKKLFDRIEGGYLYRAYLVYKNNNIPVPDELKTAIQKYRGSYPKMNIVKLLLKFPFLRDIAYDLAVFKNKCLYVIKYKLMQ